MIIYTDGSPTRIALYVEEAGRMVDREQREISFSSHLEAEWLAIIEALSYIKARDVKGKVVVANDNAVVVAQLLGKARVVDPRLRELRDSAQRALRELPAEVEFRWLRGSRNKAHRVILDGE